MIDFDDLSLKISLILAILISMSNSNFMLSMKKFFFNIGARLGRCPGCSESSEHKAQIGDFVT